MGSQNIMEKMDKSDGDRKRMGEGRITGKQSGSEESSENASGGDQSLCRGLA